jgi:DNA polymerase-3 subunit epsilon
MRLIVLDTETTGLSPDNGDRILELGCVELMHRKLTGRNFHYYINPERDSHEEALNVHGITSEFLQDKPKFAQIVDEFLAYVKGADIIIHNAPFDMGFLNKELELAGHPPFKAHVGQVMDTLAMAKEIYPGKRNSLDALCERLGVSNAARTLHGALLDAELLADVYINLTRGQEGLLMDQDDGRDASGKPAARRDYSQLTLPVIAPSADELLAHEGVLDLIDKASGGKTLWRSTASSASAPESKWVRA